MRLEQELQMKKPFRNTYHRAAINIVFTNNWLCSQIKEHLKPFDITMQQYNMLRILRGADEPVSTSCIRERMIDKMSDTSRMVERLCQKGWVNRDACCFDKRRVAVTISPKGKQLIESIEALSHDFDDMMNNLSPEEAELLGKLLDKIRK